MFPRIWGRAVFSSLRFRLLLLVGLAILPALVLAAYTGLEQQQVAATQVQANAMRLARLAANDQKRPIADTRQLMTWLNQWAANAQLPAGSTLTIINGDGTILARYPESERWVGRPLPEAPIVEVILSQQAEGTTEAIGVDHIRRLYAFTRLDGAQEATDAYLYIGIPTSIAFAEVNRMLIRNLVTLGLVMAIGLAAAWVVSDLLILRHVKALASATTRLAAGDLSVRSGQWHDGGELEQLAAAFDRMADSLERRQAEVAQAVEELRQQARDLQSRNEELDAFAHTVAHDLKNPAGLIVGFTELLTHDCAERLAEDQLPVLYGLAKSANTMTNIIDELLLLAQVRKAEVKTVPLDMGDIVAQAQQRLAYMIEQYAAEMTVPDTWPRASGYGPWVEEVWVNYLSNALKYGGQPPRVELGAEQKDEMVKFWMRDNGNGIAPEEQARLFTLFTRLEVRAKGHGLGLSIVQRIVEKLGGQVGVESDGVPGHGSLFCFTLPAAHARDKNGG